ncbi:hypothetical protein MRS44_013423 [Fusarium solani]|uniref:uncharacterized protein n=1 Tax=Fusarium solani TaxID=169388 RepID=UPI0032C44C28|nr:hypothetical protein MRS44_013423 [Fusarium solani]
MAVNWYFDIRESEYGWIKPENTVNVDEGGIMAGFDSLVIGSSDPRRKAFLKGSQSRTWTSFPEAVTATGRLLKPGIIFKGKELQRQWFIDEFRKIADWYYITSDNGWTDNHIAVEWLKEVYLPQTQPEDESDARLIILDGHRSHVSDEWMATCFLNNVYCCYLPAHCSHGLQPLDNGPFNTSKAAYRKELQKLTSLTDSAPVDKVNFIRAYAKAREVGMTKKNILSGWRVTGNWPISRRKALIHPEIQPDKKETTPASEGHRDGQVDSDNTPKTSRHIRDLGKNKSPSTRRRYSVISRGFEAQESKIASLSTRIASLEEEVGRLSRGKKRKAIPNPNKRFMTLAETLVASETISEPNEEIEGADAVEDVIEVGGMEEDERSNSEEGELTVLAIGAPGERRAGAQQQQEFTNHQKGGKYDGTLPQDCMDPAFLSWVNSEGRHLIEDHPEAIKGVTGALRGQDKDRAAAVRELINERWKEAAAIYKEQTHETKAKKVKESTKDVTQDKWTSKNLIFPKLDFEKP